MAVQADWNAQLVIGLRKGSLTMVTRALAEGADVEHRFTDKTGVVTPLRFAVGASALEIVKVLLDNGAKIIAHPNDARTRRDVRVFAENTHRENMLDGKSRAVFELLDKTQHARLQSAELTVEEVLTRRPGLSG